MKSGIYMIKCKENEKVYIGQSIDVKKRFKHHIYHLKNGKHANQHMVKAYSKYGKSVFEFTILEFCEKDFLNDREEFWINHYDSRNLKKGFNKIIGPYRGKGIKKYDSSEFKKMMSEQSKKRWSDPIFAKKNIESIRKYHKERKLKGEILSILTPESKKKAYESCHTPEFLKGLSERTYKQLENPEYRALALKNLEKGRNNPITKISMSKAKKKNWEDPEYRKMMCEKRKIKWQDPEFKKLQLSKMNKKRKERAKAQWANRKKICNTL